MKKIYKMIIYCGRMGDVESTFIADDKDVEALIGKNLNFGEVLGKHSDIHGKLEAKHIKVLSEDQKVIEVVEGLGILPTGHCPFQYYTCYSCGIVMDVHSNFRGKGGIICERCHNQYVKEGMIEC